MKMNSLLFSILPLLAFGQLAMAEDTDVGFADGEAGGGEAPANNEVESIPTADKQEVPVSDDPNIEFASTTFHFRTEKVEIKDDAGKVVETKKVKRDSFEGILPRVTPEGILNIISTGGKQLELLIEAVNDVVYSQARELISEAISKDRNVVLSQEVLPYDKLSWDFIANLPKAERRGAGIASEVWAAFEENYTEVMVALYPDKEVDRIKTAGQLLAGKFQKVKTNKPVVEALTGFLLQWYEATAAKEEFADVFQFLNDKSATLLAADETVLLNAL